jgi:hypothetical protein
MWGMHAASAAAETGNHIHGQTHSEQRIRVARDRSKRIDDFHPHVVLLLSMEKSAVNRPDKT